MRSEPATGAPPDKPTWRYIGANIRHTREKRAPCASSASLTICTPAAEKSTI